jgi:DNA-binding protein HU-beta
VQDWVCEIAKNNISGGWQKMKMTMPVRPASMPRKPVREEGRVAKKPIVGLGIIIDKVAKKTRYSKSDVGNVIRATLAIIALETSKGNCVRMPGLGTFSLTRRAEREIKTFGGDTIVVPAHRAVKFRPARVLKNLLNLAKK